MGALRRFLVLLTAVTALACSDDPSAADAGPELEPACAREDCVCESQADCLSHAECIFAEGETSSECSCVTGYDKVGDFCIFAGLADPDFDGEPAIWQVEDPAVLVADTSEPEMRDPGEVVWSSGATNALSRVSQMLTMPTLEESEQFVAVVTQRVDHTVTGLVWVWLGAHSMLRLGPQFSRIPIGAIGAWESTRVCLGEGAYGGDMLIGVEPSHRETSFVPNYTVRVDRLQIEPAAQGECPLVGEVMDGDFETSMEWVVAPGGLASIQPGVGLGDSAGGVLQATTCNQSTWLETRVSIPNSDTGQAIRFLRKSTGNAVLEVGLGRGEYPSASWWDGQRVAPIGTVHGNSDVLQPSTVCVPPYMRGTVATLRFQLQRVASERQPDNTLLCTQPAPSAVIDEVEVVDAPGCATSGLGSDLSFEAVRNAVAVGWILTKDVGRIASVEQVGDAVDGARVLRLASDLSGTLCTDIRAATGARYSAVSAGEVPAIRFSYRFSPSASPMAQLGWARNYEFMGNSNPQSVLPSVDEVGAILETWQTATICGEVADAGRPVELTFVFSPIECLADQWAEIDNVEMLAVPTAQCP